MREACSERAWLEIDLRNLKHNAAQLRAMLPQNCRLMAVVKADAYGHGLLPVAKSLQNAGVDDFAVATVGEAIQLRQGGIRGVILILGYTDPSRARDLQRYGLTQTLISRDYAETLNRQEVDLHAHIKIDTGMHRLGMDAEDTQAVKACFVLEHLHIDGLFTHFCVSDSADSEDVQFTEGQIKRFRNLLDSLTASGVPLPKIHMQSSYGLLNYPELACDYVRVGIALYGAASTPDDKTKCRPELRPVLSLRSKIVMVRSVKKGESVGYGRAFIAQRDSRIAVIPVGYADGIPRSLSCGKGWVLVAGYPAPMVGRICMDQLCVDVTDIPGIKEGMTVTLIGRDGASEITAAALADAAGTIANELLSRLGQRLEAVWIE